MAMRWIDGIGEIVVPYDAVILDLWGVVHDGVAPFPGVLDCMQRLIGAGKRVALLSNAPRRSDDVGRRITAIGVPPGLYHAIMSSGEEAWQCLARRDEPFYAGLGRTCLHIGSDRDLEIRDGLGLGFVATPEDADFILNTGPAGWDDTIADYDPVLRRAAARGLAMVCANPDLVVVHAGKEALCAGALAQHYETLGGRVRWHGKPHPSVYARCLDLIGIAAPARAIMIGDSLRTDIAGAQAAGIASILVTGGVHAAEFGGAVPDRARIEAALAGARLHPFAVTDRLRW
jgi:HAD superfamily hydrolase (TIGR01459 family)